ncbi:DNA repair protein [Aeromonas media]|uniref:DNA repair protein n=1 Tax=Aeromonas media TaxID=651 RepID=A0A6M4YG11_AERME|nr:DNA repair protein [Aeromonas media]MBP6360378.1 DNA repair protein [Aeromonas sp.]QJT22202.1 DNA repair protein [Aeromonas media]QYK82639.1 DNA repair protein [Aeromonas media]
MILTLILLSIGALLFLVIAYNVVQQYKQKAEADKRQAIARHKAVADETEEVLLNVNLVPFSKNMVLLQHRILDAYRAIVQVMPNPQVKQRIIDVQTQIKNVQENYSSQDEGHFKTPESDRQAIQMLQLAKKMRAVLRVEHNKGKIDPQGFAQEDRRLELMQLKINIANLIKRAMDAQIQGQYGTCRQLYTKGLGALANVSDKDPYLLAREEDMRQGMRQLEEHLQQHSEKELQNIKDKEADELDVLFQPKKKW